MEQFDSSTFGNYHLNRMEFSIGIAARLIRVHSTKREIIHRLVPEIHYNKNMFS